MVVIAIFLGLVVHDHNKRLASFELKTQEKINDIYSRLSHFEETIPLSIDSLRLKHSEKLSRLNSHMHDISKNIYELHQRLSSLVSDAGSTAKDKPRVVSIPYIHYRCNEKNGTVIVDSGFGRNNAMASVDLSTLSTKGLVDGGFGFKCDGHFANMDEFQGAISSDEKGTICFWTKIPDYKDGVILSFGDTDGDQVFSIRANYRLPGQLHVGFDGVLGGRSWALNVSGFWPIDEWIHFAIVQDGNEPKIYKNGNTLPFSYEMNQNSKAWFKDFSFYLDNGRLGCMNTLKQGNSLFYSGEVDDIRYYNSALSDEEIKAIYNDGKGSEVSIMTYSR